ncbi:MAG: hypothetical protein ABH805_01025 [Candidatus Nealsonbacteria bacterium]
MINLLPPEEKIRIKREKARRLIFIWGAFILFFIVSLSLIFFAIKIYIAGQAAYQRVFINLEQEKTQTMEAQDVEIRINLINHNLSKLVSFYKNQPPTIQLLERVSGIMPEEMYFNSLSLNQSQNGERKFQVSMTGFSPTREILLDFKKKLESESDLQGVYFPPSNWVKPTEINFSATFELII